MRAGRTTNGMTGPALKEPTSFNQFMQGYSWPSTVTGSALRTTEVLGSGTSAPNDQEASHAQAASRHGQKASHHAQEASRHAQAANHARARVCSAKHWPGLGLVYCNEPHGTGQGQGLYQLWPGFHGSSLFLFPHPVLVLCRWKSLYH